MYHLNCNLNRHWKTKTQRETRKDDEINERKNVIFNINGHDHTSSQVIFK